MEALEAGAGKRNVFISRLRMNFGLRDAVLKILNISNPSWPVQTRRALLDSLWAAIKQRCTTVV